MANPTIEKLLKIKEEAKATGRITKVGSKSVHVRIFGANNDKKNVPVSADIKISDLQIGMQVRLLEVNGKQTVVQVFPIPEKIKYKTAENDQARNKVVGSTNLIVSKTNSGWDLSWGAIAGATGYIIYRSGTENGTYVCHSKAPRYMKLCQKE